MRLARLLPEGRNYYHCVSRVVDRRFVFGRDEKAYFYNTMRRLERFLNVRVLTYCLMSNHFHILVEVPDRQEVVELDEARLRERLPWLYSGKNLRIRLEELDRASAQGSGRWMDEILERYQVRMGSLSIFVKELKQRFTQWHNAREKRSGTLWESRFKSVLVEGANNALITMAAYIDLNPVRAGLCADPKDYRWCGYAEAVAGKQAARRGLGRLLAATGGYGRRPAGWGVTGARYRLLLFGHGQRRLGDGRTGQGAMAGMSREAVERELARGGRLSVTEVLRSRVRYFCDGVVFGSRAYVDATFSENRDRYGARRNSGARRMRGADWGDLWVLRDLRERVFGGN